MLRLFLTKMLVTMTPHFRQQTQTYITKISGENIAIKVLVLGWQKWQTSAFLTKFLTKSVFLRTKYDILAAKSFGAYRGRVKMIVVYDIRNQSHFDTVYYVLVLALL